MKSPDRAADFVAYWRVYAPEYAGLATRHQGAGGELKFHPRRQWRFDWCIPTLRLAVEIDGGNMLCKWSPKLRRHIPVGHHVLSKDYEKLNAATEAGWIVLRYTTEMLRNNPQQCIHQVKRVVKALLESEGVR